jgi:hypothetical protein
MCAQRKAGRRGASPYPSEESDSSTGFLFLSRFRSSLCRGLSSNGRFFLPAAGREYSSSDDLSLSELELADPSMAACFFSDFDILRNFLESDDFSDFPPCFIISCTLRLSSLFSANFFSSLICFVNWTFVSKPSRIFKNASFRFGVHSYFLRSFLDSELPWEAELFVATEGVEVEEEESS